MINFIISRLVCFVLTLVTSTRFSILLSLHLRVRFYLVHISQLALKICYVTQLASFRLDLIYIYVMCDINVTHTNLRYWCLNAVNFHLKRVFNKNDKFFRSPFLPSWPSRLLKNMSFLPTHDQHQDVSNQDTPAQLILVLNPLQFQF